MARSVKQYTPPECQNHNNPRPMALSVVYKRSVTFRCTACKAVKIQSMAEVAK